MIDGKSPRNKRVVVVGAGLGGLAAAASLRAEGFDVQVVEKNERIGGKLNFHEIDGFGFDLGPSIFTLPQFFESIWARAGKRMGDYVGLEKVTPHWRNFFEDGLVLDLHEDMDRMKAELAKLPGDREVLWKQFEAFLAYGREQYHLVDEGYFREGLDNVWEMLRYYGWRLIFKMDHRHTMAESIANHFEEEHLRHIFEYFIKYVGSSALDAPGYMNLMPLIQFDYGLWYVQGGMYNLARGLGRLLDDLGVEVRLNSEVASIDRKGNRVTGITLASGETLAADYVVCNMEVIPAYRKLLSEPPAFLKKLEKFAPASSCTLAPTASTNSSRITISSSRRTSTSISIPSSSRASCPRIPRSTSSPRPALILRRPPPVTTISRSSPTSLRSIPTTHSRTTTTLP